LSVELVMFLQMWWESTTACSTFHTWWLPGFSHHSA